MKKKEQELKKPFDASEIEWRISRSGDRDGKVWATCLCYISNRAIMNRLDEVFGIDGWRNEFIPWHGNSQLCGISVKIGDEWVTKWDGADQTDFEGTKGGLSDSMKRAAVQWGIGRYLYNLDEAFAVISSTGKHYQAAGKDKNGAKGTPAFKWDAPKLPEWALPSQKSAVEMVRDTFEGDRDCALKEDFFVYIKNAKTLQDLDIITKDISENKLHFNSSDLTELRSAWTDRKKELS